MGQRVEAVEPIDRAFGPRIAAAGLNTLVDLLRQTLYGRIILCMHMGRTSPSTHLCRRGPVPGQPAPFSGETAPGRAHALLLTPSHWAPMRTSPRVSMAPSVTSHEVRDICLDGELVGRALRGRSAHNVRGLEESGARVGEVIGDEHQRACDYGPPVSGPNGVMSVQLQCSSPAWMDRSVHSMSCSSMK